MLEDTVIWDVLGLGLGSGLGLGLVGAMLEDPFIYNDHVLATYT